MLKNYFKATYRNLWKNKGYSFLNTGGLAIGVAWAVLIFLWVEDELTFNHYFNNRSNLYKVKARQTNDGTTFVFDATPGPLAKGIKAEIPGIKNTARTNWGSQSLFSLGEKNIYEQGIYVDPGFLSMFQLRFINGNAGTAFSNLYSIVISETMANKFFGSTDVIGKTLKADNKPDYIIPGVSRTFLKMSPLNLTGSLLLKSLRIRILAAGRGNNGIVTYVESQPNGS